MLLLPVQTAFAQVNNVPKPPINTPSKPTTKPNPRPATRPTTRPNTRPSNKPHNRPRITTGTTKTSIDVSFSCNVYDEPVAIMIDGKLSGDIDSVFTLTTGTHKVLVTADGYAPYSTSIKVDETDDGDFFYFELDDYSKGKCLLAVSEYKRMRPGSEAKGIMIYDEKNHY